MKHKIDSFFFNYKTGETQILSKIIIIFSLLNILSLIPDFHDLYSTIGYVSDELNDIYVYGFDPLLAWLIEPLTQLGLKKETALSIIIIIGYVVSLLLSLFRYKPFIFSITAWLIHVMLVNSSYYFSYGADYFITLALFINVLLNLDSIIKNKFLLKCTNSFVFRFIQIQLCFVYFFAGFGKILVYKLIINYDYFCN